MNGTAQASGYLDISYSQPWTPPGENWTYSGSGSGSSSGSGSGDTSSESYASGNFASYSGLGSHFNTETITGEIDEASAGTASITGTDHGGRPVQATRTPAMAYGVCVGQQLV